MPSVAGHASRPFLLRDVPLPVSDFVARPDAPLRPAALMGFDDPSQCCSCPPGFGSFLIRLTHLPFSERRPDDFVGGSAVHSCTVQIFRHPLVLSDSRSRTFAAASGFRASRAIRSGSVSLDRSGRDCRGLCLLQVFGTPCLALPIRPRRPAGPSAAGNPLPAPIRS
jgi:hypothetical protein